MVGSGVTFYLTGNSTYPYKGVDIDIANVNSLSAPTSGAMEGILFFQDRNISASDATNNPNTIFGANLSKYEGTLYFPNTALSITGVSGANTSQTGALYTVIIADTVHFTGVSYTEIDDNYSLLEDGSPVKSVALTE